MPPFISAEYIVYSMAITAICLFFTLGVLNLHHHRPETPVPRLLHLCILHWLAHCVFLHRKSMCGVCDKNSSSKGNSISPVSPRDVKVIDDMRVEDLEKKSVMRRGPMDELLPADVVAFIRKKIADSAEEEVHAKNKSQWEHAANVMDRFLLILTFIGILAMSLAYLLVIMHGP